MAVLLPPTHLSWLGLCFSAPGINGTHLSCVLHFCDINRITRPKSGYGGKWDPSKWWGSCTQREQQKKSRVSVCPWWQHHRAFAGSLTFIDYVLYPTNEELLLWLFIVPLFNSLGSYFARSRPDFDDSDDGSKLFRYACLVSGRFVQEAAGPDLKPCSYLPPFRCDDDAAGSNNDKERFAR